jgi:hypothetical protein
VDGAGLTLYEQLGLSSKSDRFTGSNMMHIGVPSGMVTTHKMDQFDRFSQRANLEKAPAVKFKDLEAAVSSTIKYNLLPMRVRTDYFPITGASVNTRLKPNAPVGPQGPQLQDEGWRGHCGYQRRGTHRIDDSQTGD